MATPTKFSDIIVAVHGIGSQKRNATVRTVATIFAESSLKGTNNLRAPLPLGYFHTDVKDISHVCLLDDPANLSGPLKTTGFTEVFWADVPQEVAAEGRTLEETKAWGRAVIARAQGLCANKTIKEREPDFTLAAEVLDEIVDAVYVMENLCFLAEKAGVFQFDLKKVLEEYLGDVQLMTEFTYYRNQILGRLHLAMEQIYDQQRQLGNPEVRLHIVAHSEGTVVSFLGLLHALSGTDFSIVPTGGNPRSGTPVWIKNVHGHVTLGSPIDKHLLLWPHLFDDLKPTAAATPATPAPGQIRWRNYYDYGDPVGFKLDTAREWLGQRQFTAFEFCGCPTCQHDIGFARYSLPGKAHNDYWKDRQVFDDIVDEVIAPRNPRPRAPKSRPLVYFLSPALPYLMSFIVLLIGVWLVYKATTNFTHPSDDPLQRYLRFTLLGVRAPEPVSGWQLLQHSLAITALIAGTTLFSRFPRLAGWPWVLCGSLSLVLGFGAYWLGVSATSRAEIGVVFSRLGPSAPTWGLFGLSIVFGLFAWLATRPSRENPDRRQRWFWRGMRPLMACGAIGTALIVGSQAVPSWFTESKIEQVQQQGIPVSTNQIAALQEARLSQTEINQLLTGPPATLTNNLNNLSQVSSVLTPERPVWPLLLSAVAFLYLWWLAALLFDLGFVWHRYIRRSVGLDRLRRWAGYDRTRPPPGSPLPAPGTSGAPAPPTRRSGNVELCRNPHAKEAGPRSTRRKKARVETR